MRAARVDLARLRVIRRRFAPSATRHLTHVVLVIIATIGFGVEIRMRIAETLDRLGGVPLPDGVGVVVVAGALRELKDVLMCIRRSIGDTLRHR